MGLQNLIGYAAAILGLSAFLPQAIKTWKTKETKDISLGMYVVFWLGVVLWLTYGIFLKNPAIILVNTIVFILATVIIVLKIKYK